MRNSVAILVLLTAFSASAAEKTLMVPVYAINEEGVGDAIGTITLSDSKKGLILAPNLSNLPPGEHGIHVHEKDSCDGALKDGQAVAGLAAGGHFDPAGTGKHLGPEGEGHKGDLPLLKVGANGRTGGTLTAPHLTLADVMNHAVIIHQGGDNYSDDPKPLGGGGARIACGVVK